MARRALLLYLAIILPIVSCSSGKPPEALFTDNIRKMVLLDRAMEFKEEITRISIVAMTVYEEQVEVEVRVEGWATHKDLTIGAVLPVSRDKNSGWARWKFFCRKVDNTWMIVEKYKVEEGFDEQ